MHPQQSIAHYRILSKLGEGGMGVVYRATDTKLGRDVAIKLLPASLSNDLERLARFTREARTLASLNHPNIAAIYGIEEGALVMELVEGPTLYDRIKSGAITESEAIAIARQIVDALEAAHEKGIVHRDLKPANIKLTPDGGVKLLDFGIAKAADDNVAPSDPNNSPTITVHASMTGVILGTAGYMSPEQARGLKVDRRADIWAFGVVLYEMLTGASLFQGDTVADKMAAILTHEPEIDRAPQRLRPLLRRCLQKDPRKRLGWIGDVRHELDGQTPAPSVQPAPARNRWLIPVLSAVGAAVLVAALFQFRQPQTNEPPVRRFVIPVTGLTSGPGPAPNVQISPDGKRIAYVANNRLWIRDLDQNEAQVLLRNEPAQGPIWSPDSRQLVYYSRNRLWRTGIDVPSPVFLANVVGLYSGGAWSPDGSTIVFGSAYGIEQVPAGGGEKKTIKTRTQEMGSAIFGLQFVPGSNGEHLLFGAGSQLEPKLFLFHLKTGETKALFGGGNPFLTSDGHLLFSRGDRLFAAPFSVNSGVGTPFALDTKGWQGTVSLDGTLVSVPQLDTLATRLAVRDRSGKLLRTVGATQVGMRFLSVSVDGKRAAVTSEEQGSADIWIHDLERGLKSRLTLDNNSTENYPRFSPDGRMIAYSSTRNGNPDVFIQPADGSQEPVPAVNGPEPEFPNDWSLDGKFLVLTFISPGTARDVWYAARNGDGTWAKPVPLQKTEFDEQSGRISPNGRFLLFRSLEAGESTIFVRPFPSGPGRWQVSSGGVQPRWSRDGKEIYYRLGETLMAVQVSTEGAFSSGATQRLFSTGAYDLSDVAMNYDTLPGGNFVVIEPVEAENQPKPQLEIVENWLRAFRPANRDRQ